ncbi:SH3 domain-containing protein [Ruegeria sp. WL0004]|uniref:SH3 domain-containing protein n=1 Tax=Ruegeria marisflavi TaxID=2984152 RepID=A0ABT2WV95_9RHOB|nr:SH3 domain-containing protein [Ruegeria sp. WL0004]MCU9839573.1 SH3 domain-containing protein [Ruegeria sp. WL0004]
MLHRRYLCWTIFGACALASAASGQSADFMRNECSSAGQTYFRDFTAATEMQYNGRRVDGTHAINGRIFLETRFEDFACSYDPFERRMVEFFAEGRTQASPLPGGGGSSDPAGSRIVTVWGIAANDVLNVRSGPRTNYRIIGALRNGDRVRQLRCQTPGRTTWCEIEMLTDMRERGWVSARYLTGGGSQGGTATQLPSPPSTHGGTATQLPSPPSVTGAGQTTTVTVRFPPGANGTELREQLAPGATRRYILNARALQFLYFRLASTDPGMTWRIQNPDSTLLDRATAAREYRGQFWQSGNHVIEVINGSNRSRSYTVIFGIN